MNDDLLSTLLTDAVADVEPADRLDEIRARVDGTDPRRRTWWLAGGAALAVAASIAVVAVSSTPREHTAVPPEPVGPPSSTSPTPSTEPPLPVAAVPVYYIGTGPGSGPVLYREFHSVGIATLTDTLQQVEKSPYDPDYRSAWSPGDFGEVTLHDDVLTVQLANPDLRTRPAGMTQEEAELSIQQVIYTVQAAAQQRLPVQFTYGANPIDQVLGVPTSEPLVNGPVLDTLSRVNLTNPEEGATASGTLHVEGVANSFEANVPWLLEDASGNDVANGAFTATGWMDTKLFPFEGSVDVSSLDPGRYSLIVFTDDPSGGSEGPGASSDSRTVVIE